MLADASGLPKRSRKTAARAFQGKFIGNSYSDLSEKPMTAYIPGGAYIGFLMYATHGAL